MKNMRRTLLVVMAAALLLVMTVGGTLAWLVDSTDPVENTFTVGNIGITLTETTGATYHLVPGVDLQKDPTVTVAANSEPCYVFVKIEETNWPTEKVPYTVADGWTALDGATGVYYREVATSATAQAFSVIANNTIVVSENLTKQDMNGLTTPIKLTFTAYAIQKAASAEANFTPATAWAELNK